MSGKRKIIKWSLIAIASIVLLLVGFGYWFMSLLDPVDPTASNIENTMPGDLSYIHKNQPTNRGKVLAVVTSCGLMGESKKNTGYELTELARAYYVFEANGYEVDIASPKGGKPPVVIDDDDMGAFDYAFLNDNGAQEKANKTVALKDVKSGDYDAIYFVGGKGAMFDFPQNKYIQSIVSEYYEAGKVVSAVCHGPSAFINVTLSDGRSLLKGKVVSAFTNKEELFLIKEARATFPFLLQERLVEIGASFNEGSMYLEQVSVDGNLITGQNPWSTWATAEAVVKQLGHEPKKRMKTDEENAVMVLSILEKQDYASAKAAITVLRSQKKLPINRSLIAIHSIVSVMQGDFIKAIEILRLLSYAKSMA